MAKELLLYSNVNNWTAQEFILALEEAANTDVTLRINTDGGNPQDSYGMIAKWKEHKGKKNAKVDGKAYSTGTYFLCFTDYAEALDVSEFLFHRAAFSEWYEASEYMTQAEWDALDRINKTLRTATEAKINVKLFEKIKGVTLDEIFSNKSRVDVFLNAEEALQIGLINKINPITPQAAKEIAARMDSVAAMYNGKAKPISAIKIEPEVKSKTTNMTLDEFKAQHPAIYNQVLALGVKQGTESERERVEAWMEFKDIDVEAVATGIRDGKSISMKVIAEFSRKGLSAEALKKLKEENAPVVETEEPESKERPEAAKKKQEFQAEVNSMLGIKA